MSVILKSVANSLIAPENVAYQLDPGRRDAMFDELRQWAKALLFTILIVSIVFTCMHVGASDGTEFQDASQKFENWVKGNAGKLAALVCVMIGMFMAAVRKDWNWLFGGVALGLLVGIIVGIINASFTATI
ncbi:MULTISPECIES: hypothetical protein [Burkholderia]|uniref:Membrane protein n=2 Tax=Burkholderia TaxID=32008 RepID=B4EQI6_BURCJ|nr:MULTISPECIES: hypothetical protein [Burkholderia cepacia complex]EPZ84578.1 hypothetical protein BURCENK562V_C0100 [Burkholderia cenocepacia K56-2Valvano]ERI28605.1 hypothetical protein BURCENBC7_AP0298 [Burkholderia cenocepacia BC7]KIS46006.1 hypothetical protein NP88_7284 [Burkholderia cepacia]MBR8034664.1 hypothetical protein [Burkholderia vietnamiensis]MDI9695381.1 hypothetical protein [Burkholderia cenocepacia]